MSELMQTCNMDERTNEEKLLDHIAELKQALNLMVTEYCDRAGPEDIPIGADDQSCQAVSNAMKVLEGREYCDHDWEYIGGGREQCTYPNCQPLRPAPTEQEASDE